jgi:hypothetical protein
VSQSDELTNELNGAFVTKVRTSYTYDGYGNPTNVTATHLTAANAASGFSKTTVNNYTNDTTNWLLGRLTSSTVTSVIP